MQSITAQRYRRLAVALGLHRRWYQTSTDQFFGAVAAAVEDTSAEDLITAERLFSEALPRAHELNLISYTMAAIAAAHQLDVSTFVEAADAAAESLRPATRSTRFRRVAGAVLAAEGTADSPRRADEAMATYRLWKQAGPTYAADLVLAAVAASAGIKPEVAAANARIAADWLARSGYRAEQDVARILALHEPEVAAGRFVTIADRLRGRRRKPLRDRRESLAIAALSFGAGPDLPELVAHRAGSVRTGRWRPNRKTALSLAALLTFGESVPLDHRLHPAFHGFALREHYETSYAEATSG